MKKKVIVNGVEFEVEEGASLKALLTQYGFDFPCGGRGNCGKCRVRCKSLPVTEKDKVFFSEEALKDGWRISCDKTIGTDMEITFEPPKSIKPKRALESCNIAVRIGSREIVVSIADDEVAESVTIPNPLFSKEGLSGVAKAYEAEPNKCSNALRGAIGKTSIDLFEKYGKARAEMLSVATNGFFARILAGIPLDKDVTDYNAFIADDNFRLPTETMYFLPIKNMYVGGDLFAETVYFTENTLAIDCDDVFTVMYIGKEGTVLSSMWDLTYDEIGLKAVYAAVRTIIPDGYIPIVKLFGKRTQKVEELLVKLGLNYGKCEKKQENVARTFADLRFRTNLAKECSRASVLDMLSNEKFHTYFSEEIE